MDVSGDRPNAGAEPNAGAAADETARIDPDRLTRLLGGPGLDWLVERARHRLARGEPLTGTVTLASATAAQRGAAERLLGRAPRPGRSLSVRLDEVDAVLRRSRVSPAGLAAAVTALTGPVVPLAEARERQARAWEEAYAPLAALPAELADWADDIRRDGLVRRLARSPDAARPLLAATVSALGALPAEPARPLPEFAAQTLGDAHALDDGTPLATLVRSGVRALTGFPDGEGAEWRRAAWASAGLLKDALSATVLALGVRGTAALDALADAGEPAVLTLRQLAHGAPRPPATAPAVYVCENPAVVAAAADAYGADCAPLVCLQGQPSAAALTLLRLLHTAGARLLYHGDFDWGGLRIAGGLLRRVPWRPWRYTAADYRAAAATMPLARPLRGTPASAPWDPALSAALTEVGVGVEEESVIDDLLSDLIR